MTNAANWRITFPIEKAEAREDGLYLTGLASGPEIDGEGERMERSLIHKFADQINARGGLPLTDKLVYRDAHAPDGVLRDLGWVTRAWVNEHGQLGVEVRLDDTNPAATYLFRQATPIEKGGRGKQYGMSVAGKVLDFVDEFIAEVGKTVRTYKDVVLTEISNTTRPAWTPSFGSVLSKAIDDAAGAESLQGVTVMTDELTQETTTEASADETTEKAAEETVETTDTEATTETTEKAEEETTESTDEDVAKAGRRVSAKDRDALLGAYNTFTSTLRDLGLIEADTNTEDSAEKADSEDEGDTVEKADEGTAIAALNARIDELVKSNTELTAKVAELEQRPATTLPPVIERADSDEVDDFRKSLADLDPAARLRVAFAAATGGK